MNIIVRSILHYIQSRETSKNAILAGGAVRDEQFDLVPNDYDIFVPVTKRGDIRQLTQEICKEFGIVNPPLVKDKNYEEATQSNVKDVNEFEHEGMLFDLIGVVEPDDEDFPNTVINSFDYGLNMIYDTGSYVENTNEHYIHDADMAYMSLINLKEMSGLPKAVKRFDEWNIRAGGGWRFKAPCLKFKDDRNQDTLKINKPRYTGGWANAVGAAVPAPDLLWEAPALGQVMQPPMPAMADQPIQGNPFNQQPIDAAQAHIIFENQPNPFIALDNNMVIQDPIVNDNF